jgi:NAD(P)-dependent dehydrogenase (short-subunit alcohol dehydrogenase family)
MSKRLEGKVAVVARASKGIGTGIAKHLAADDSAWVTGEVIRASGGVK